VASGGVLRSEADWEVQGYVVVSDSSRFGSERITDTFLFRLEGLCREDLERESVSRDSSCA
jgi:hypothetical protein